MPELILADLRIGSVAVFVAAISLLHHLTVAEEITFILQEGKPGAQVDDLMNSVDLRRKHHSLEEEHSADPCSDGESVLRPPQHGMMVRGKHPGKTISFASSESTTVTHRPILRVVAEINHEHVQDDPDELKAVAEIESQRFIRNVTGPVSATGIRIVFRSQPTAKRFNYVPGRYTYEVRCNVRVDALNAEAEQILKATGVYGDQEVSNLIYFVDKKPVHDSLYFDNQLMHIENKQWEDFQQVMPAEEVKRHSEYVRWIINVREQYKKEVAGRYGLLPVQHLQLEGVKFHAYSSKKKGTTQLYRVMLKDGWHKYIVEDEIESHRKLFKSPPLPMEAYVCKTQVEGSKKLFRFVLKDAKKNDDPFLTVFEPEMKGLLRNEHVKIQDINVFAFPHDISRKADDDLVPVYSFYNHATGRHFYTESEFLKNALVELREAAHDLPEPRQLTVERELSFDNLRIGKTYLLSKKTPLMPTWKPGKSAVETANAIANMNTIPESSTIRVVEIQARGNNRWYNVIAISEDGMRIGKGWVNSTALMGQSLKEK